MNTNRQVITTEQYANNQRPSYEVLRKWMDLPLAHIPYFIRDLLKKRNDIPVEVLQQWLDDSDAKVRWVAMTLCEDRSDIPLGMIRQGLADEDFQVNLAAERICAQRSDISPEQIQQWLESGSWELKKVARYACYNHDDISRDAIQQGLEDTESTIRKVAERAVQGHRDKQMLPSARCIEPPEYVYQKCVGDVIVVASIPKDAQIKVGRCGDYRASRAIIVEVIGKLCGEPAAVSFSDDRLYYAGDEVAFGDFGRGKKRHFNGFHFYCTIQEAMDSPKSRV